MKKKWGWYLLFFLSLGIFMGILSAYMYNIAGKKPSFIYIVLKQVSFWFTWFLLYEPVLYLITKVNRQKQKQNLRVLRHAMLFVATVCVHYTTHFVVVYFGVMPFLIPERATPLGYFLVNLPDALGLSLLTYGAILLIHYVTNYHKKYKDEELKNTQIAEKLAQAELHALKMQLHPHFLFNTLHAISALMHKDIVIAEKMINRLSELLRYSLKNTGQQLVTLRQELEFLELYLEIETIRFQDRLQIEMNISPQVLDAEVPHLILQPLVENALRHGIAPKASGGTIEITACASKHLLKLKVQDNGKSVLHTQLQNLKEGIGLQNTRLRLQQLYDKKHQLDIGNCDEKGFEVTIEFPLKFVSVHEYQSVNS